MKLNYKVLWIDDREDSLPPIQQPIRDYLDDLGFKLDVVWRKDGSEVESLAADPELDLIIMDQNLGHIPGDELIKKIRQHEKFIEIILYSQDPGTNLKDKDAGIDGIYRTHRNDIEKVLKRVIDRTIRKTQDLNVMRGLVIAETIDIEHQIEKIMVKAFEEKGQFFREEVLDKFVYDFHGKWSFLCSIVKDIISRPDIAGSSSTSTAKRALVVAHNKDRKALESLHKILKTMSKEVLDVRNVLAHSRVEYDAEGKPVLRGLNKSLKYLHPNSKWCQTMRRTLLKHEENLRQIHAQVYGEE
jgi:CheY-like chemotaxis protein